LEKSFYEGSLNGHGGGFAGLVVVSSFVVDPHNFVLAVADVDQVFEVGGKDVDDDAANGEDKKKNISNNSDPVIQLQQ